jgi:steroid delta-isomerase-like uncharacterized protein
MATMQSDLEKQIRDVVAAMNAHDIEKYLFFATDDVIAENVAMGVTIRGKEEYRSNLKLLFAAFPDYRIELTSHFGSGNLSCAEAVVSGTHKGDFMGIPATGRAFSVRGVSVAELREGKASRITAYSDSASMLRQLGVSPAPQK